MCFFLFCLFFVFFCSIIELTALKDGCLLTYCCNCFGAVTQTRLLSTCCLVYLLDCVTLCFLLIILEYLLMLVEICYVRVSSLNRFHSTFLFSLTCYVFYSFFFFFELLVPVRSTMRIKRYSFMMYHPLYPLFQMNSSKVEWSALVQNQKQNRVTAAPHHVQLVANPRHST